MEAEGRQRAVRVLPDVTAVRKTFDYAVPDHMAPSVRVGTQVRVVLGGRRVGGWVVATDVEPPPGIELRALSAVRGWGPPPSVLAVAEWAAWRWAGPVPALLRTASWDRAARSLPAAPTPLATSPVAPPAGLADGVRVVRLGPGADLLPVCLAAAARLRHGDGVLVLAPAQHAAARMARRLAAEGVAVALLPDAWPMARAGGCVAVGTRAAAFAPLERLAAAVVLDAHDEAYHEERAPTWAAWAVVAERARRDGAPCVLVSPCPTLELLAAGARQTVSRAAERAAWPVVEVVDRRSDDPRTGLFSERVVRLVRAVLASPRGRVVCVINRTGRVRLVSCAACGELARCEHCGGALELVADVASARSLNCRRCGAKRPVVCARCGGTRTRALRIGVTRVREELEALVGAPVEEVWGPVRPGPSAARADRDTRHEAGRAADGERPARVVVGTEAALHRVPSAATVVFLDFDAELLAPRFRAGEQALALLARAARLVSGADGGPGARAPGGRPARAPGRVVVQTRQPRHPAVLAAVAADPGVLERAEAEVRGVLGLPPFSAMAVVSGAASDAYGAALATDAPAGVEVRGPVDGSWSVRAPDHGALCDLLAAVPRPAGRIRVEVDPVRA